MLIVFEGIDGCGKDTQIKLLKEKLGCTVFKYPTGSNKMLNDYLEKKISPDPKALFLTFLSDIAEDQANVEKALSEGKTVVLDRYVFSTIAYEVNGIDYIHGKQIVEGVGYLKPDLVILLDIDSKTSQERKRKQKELDRYEENPVYLEKVRKTFIRLHEERFLTPNWQRIDATKSVDDVHKEIMRVLKR
jgi:dTMP kinase